jgi:uncharacterized membrane protein YhaH (DUF805 family)
MDVVGPLCPAGGNTVRFLRYCFSFYGRFNRADFWKGLGIALVADIVPIALLMAAPNTIVETVDGPWYLLWPTLWLVSICAISSKRLHDLGHSGWLSIPVVVTIIVAEAVAIRVLPDYDRYPEWLGIIGIIYLGSARGVKGANRYGPESCKDNLSTTEDQESRSGRNFPPVLATLGDYRASFPAER